ncbi:MAG: hypothetical protein RR107_01925 [Clostridia bacterium]
MIIEYYFGEYEELYEFNADFKQVKDALMECDRAELVQCVNDFADDEKKAEIDLKTCEIDEIVMFIINNDLEKYLEEYLADYFEIEAKEMWKAENDFQKDPYRYNGVSQRDFL